QSKAKHATQKTLTHHGRGPSRLIMPSNAARGMPEDLGGRPAGQAHNFWLNAEKLPIRDMGCRLIVQLKWNIHPGRQIRNKTALRKAP
ncbi:MAG TPA: hypothetical protein VL752_12165, partial [Acidisoma sp.]|uniref:hypothetical protein n=1 Tax=Acidisoma sp. TaxID=1872115 RepID=UPI002BBCFB52